MKAKIGSIEVPRHIFEMLRSDEYWLAKLQNAKSPQDKEQILIGFCHRQGIVLHHDITAGKLVMARGA